MDLYYLHLCLEIHANIGSLLDFLVSNHLFFFCVFVWKIGNNVLLIILKKMGIPLFDSAACKLLMSVHLCFYRCA